MPDLLMNPVYNALLDRDSHLGSGTGNVKYFDEQVSPFAGFQHGFAGGFNELSEQLPDDRGILYAIPEHIEEPAGWKIVAGIEGLQFVLPAGTRLEKPSVQPVLLDHTNTAEMMALASLTKPGPFGPRTIEFGQYHGIFENGQLIAMTGERLHVEDFTEVSAVCTHPDHLGKGLAAALILHQLDLIASRNQQAFLHVRADNERAIALYDRLGFKVSRTMNFYFMKKIIV